MSREPRSRAETFAEQLLEHGTFLKRLARPLVGDEQRAEDVVQDAFALAIERPPREARSLRGWLAVVVSNLARNERRGAERRLAREQTLARERAYAHEQQTVPGALALETLEVQRGLIELVVALPEEQRTVLYLRYYEGLTPSAIAERLAVPVKTIKARHTRALAELRTRLDARANGDREAWVSALLPMTTMGHPVPAPTSLARLVRGARGMKLALGLAATLMAVFAWLTLERSQPRPQGAQAAALAIQTSAPHTDPARIARAAPTSELTTPVREPQPATEDPPTDQKAAAAELTLVLEPEYSRVRELGWARAGASDGELVEAVAAIVSRRCRSLGRPVRLHVDVERNRIELVLPALDARERELFEAALRDLGLCEFLFQADETSLAGLDIDLVAEKQKLDLWRGAHPELPLTAFDVLDPAQGGPHPRLTWLRTRFGDKLGAETPLLLPARLDDHLGAASFMRMTASEDSFGYPALWCEVLPSRWNDLARITEAHMEQRIAVVIGDQVRSAPTLNEKWVGGAAIEGRFKDEELVRLADSFRKLDGPLRIVEER